MADHWYLFTVCLLIQQKGLEEDSEEDSHVANVVKFTVMSSQADGSESCSSSDRCSSICSEQPYQGYNYQNMYSTEEAAEWLENVAQCQQLNYDEGYAIYSNNGYSYTRSYSSYNGNRYQSQEQQQQQYEQQQAQQYEMYAGMMCNAAGTGMEIGIFLDDECT
eukprot:scaffold6158_cov67-Cylindrotheca_fusiformis.AAC.3